MGLLGRRVGHREVGPLVTVLLAAPGERHDEDHGREGDGCATDDPTHEPAFLRMTCWAIGWALLQHPADYPNRWPDAGVGRR